MFNTIVTETMMTHENPANAIGLISALIFHRLLKKADVVIHEIDLEENEFFFGTFLLEKPKDPKTTCRISLESAVRDILYEDIDKKITWSGLRNFKKLEERIIKALEPRVRLAEILSSAVSLQEAQTQVETEFGSFGKNLLIIRKGA